MKYKTKDRIIEIVILLSGIVVLIWAILTCSGCTTIKYGDLTYQRIGGQQFDNFSLTKTDTGDILVEFDKYTGEGVGPVVAAAVKAAVEAAK